MIEVLKPGPVCVDVEGLSLTEHERGRLRHPMTGMVILFTRNYRDREQLRALCDEIHAVRPGILISVDHEGGRVQRSARIHRCARHVRDRGARGRRGALRGGRSRACRRASRLRRRLHLRARARRRLRPIGRDRLAQPWHDAELVTAHAAALIRGASQGGMASCGKHFPGHGWAEADSHTALPEDERDAESLMGHAPLRQTA